MLYQHNTASKYGIIFFCLFSSYLCLFAWKYEHKNSWVDKISEKYTKKKKKQLLEQHKLPIIHVTFLNAAPPVFNSASPGRVVFAHFYVVMLGIL